MKRTLSLDGSSLRWPDVQNILEDKVRLAITPAALRGVTRSRAVIERAVASGKQVYGVTTGFGRLSSITIPREQQAELQKNLILSHAVGVGPTLSLPETRLFLACRINALAKGYSGIRRETLQALLTIYNKQILPVIPEQGSVGASGDLAPLSHLALILIGEGQAWFRGKKMTGRQVLARASLKPLQLQAKEGLALINGTQLMLAIGAKTWLEAKQLADTADVAGAMTFEALHGCPDAFEDVLHAVRPHPGQRLVAKRLRDLTRGSQLIGTTDRVQDAYSLRCMPQVHGAVRDALSYVEGALLLELNSATDNPLVFPRTGKILSGGNFHGQPLSLALDTLGIAIAQLTGISERRIERLVNPDLSKLPAFLIESSGLQSGLMMAQVTAAALTSENKVHAHPASVDSIPTSANQEDFVSMGVTAARKARQIVTNARIVLAIELMAAAQALEFSLAPSPRSGSFGRPKGKTFSGPYDKQPGRGVAKAYRLVRSIVPPLKKDRVLSTDIQKLSDHLSLLT